MPAPLAAAGRLGRILVRLPNWLGDALLARPLLHALAGAHPGAELVALGPAALLDLLGDDVRFAARVAWRPRGGAAAAAGGRPDAAIVLPPSFSSAWFALRTGAPIRVGFAHEGRSGLLTHAIRRPARGELHLSREYLALGAVLGAGEMPGALPPLGAPAAGAAGAARLLEAKGLGGARLALLGPGAIYGPAKRWPAERFGALGRRLETAGWRVLVCGTAAERDSCARAADAGGGLALAAGETDLATQAGLCAAARLAVCNDSGLAHLAAAIGTPTVAVFGSTSSAWTAPLGASVRVVQRPPVCSPCFRRTCAIGYRCLERVSEERVWRACEELAA